MAFFEAWVGVFEGGTRGGLLARYDWSYEHFHTLFIRFMRMACFASRAIPFVEERPCVKLDTLIESMEKVARGKGYRRDSQPVLHSRGEW